MSMLDKRLDFYSYNMNESIDIDDFVDELLDKALLNIQNRPFDISLNSINDHVYFSVKFLGMELIFTTNDYTGQKFLRDEAGFKIWIKISDHEEDVIGLSKLPETDLRKFLYNYFTKNKRTIVHELTHVFHGVIGQDSNAYKYDGMSDRDYANLPEEVDAFTTEIVHLIRDAIKEDPAFKDKLKLEIAKGLIWKYVIGKLANDKNISRFLSYLTPENEKKVLTRINRFLK